MMLRLLRWLRAHKSSAAGLVLVALGCYALLSLSRRVQHMGPKHPVATAAAPAVPDRPANTPSEAGATSLRDEFDGAARYADFIGRATARPQQGGRFYALLAWKRCEAVRPHVGAWTATGGGNDAWRDGAQALVQDLGKRCADVLQTWTSVDALYRTALQGGGRDPLLPEDGRGIATPARRETAEADLDAALRSGDRRVVAEVLRANAGWLDAGNSTGDRGVDRQLRDQAGEIVACELAGDCRGGLAAALHCVASGDCAHDDWRDIVLAQVPESQRVIFDTMLAALRARAGVAPGP